MSDKEHCSVCKKELKDHSEGHGCYLNNKPVCTECMANAILSDYKEEVEK